MAKRTESYYEVLTAAINDLAEHGYDSVERVRYWEQKLRQAAYREMRPDADMERLLRDGLTQTFKRLVDSDASVTLHRGVSRYTLQQVKPKLRAELDRRIMASADLIKRNRTEAVEKTLQRFSGWATSIPVGGTDQVDRRGEKVRIRKSLTALPYEERRVLIDQGHKLTASINNIVATDGGAIAVVWKSRWRVPGYNYRVDHKERDGRVYLLRGSWAQQQGLVKPGDAGYYDEITAFAEEPFCRCSGQYVYTLRGLPPDMLTRKGSEALEEARAKIGAV